jgi:hypothetical protein
MPLKVAAAERALMRTRYDAAMRAGNVEHDYERALRILREIQRDMAQKPSAYSDAQRETIARGIRQTLAAAENPALPEARQSSVPVPTGDPFGTTPIWVWVAGGLAVVALGYGMWTVSRR